MVFAENIRAEELESILGQLAEEPANKATVKGTFESLVVTALSGEERSKLSELFGMDAAEWESPKRHGDTKLFDRMIIEAPKGKQKKAVSTPAQQPERYAMVVARGAGRGGASSEVRTFLASRAAPRPGTMQVMVVIHQA